jgi:hypothetical protein
VLELDRARQSDGKLPFGAMGLTDLLTEPDASVEKVQ